MTPQLYMIATPLGNLEDLTLRARRLFEELECFFVEDSREFKKLLNMLNIALQGKRVFSYAAHNMKESTEQALQILHEGKSIGFVSDRGTPAISDPGAVLVDRAHQAGIKVVPIPGASAVSALVSVSGLTDGRFFFQGFLPNTSIAREEIYRTISDSELPLCFFESPKRIRETIRDLRKRFPSGRVFLGRELTKLFESLNWYNLAELEDSHIDAEVPELGEYACLLVPGSKDRSEALWHEEVQLRALTEKEWSKRIASRFNVAASEVYNALQHVKKIM